MKTYNLSAQPRTEIGKKASKLLRNAGLIPVGLIGGERVDLPYAGALKEGERVVDLGNNKNLFVVSVILIAGIGGFALKFGKVTITSIACALILGILTNVLCSIGGKKEAEVEGVTAEDATIAESMETSENDENKAE